MREAGFKTINIAKKNDSWSILDEVEALIIPDDLQKEFSQKEGSLEFYSVGLFLLKELKLDKRE